MQRGRATWVGVMACALSACTKPNPYYAENAGTASGSASGSGSASASGGGPSSGSGTNSTTPSTGSGTTTTTADGTEGTTTGSGGVDLGQYGFRRRIIVTADPVAGVPLGASLSFSIDTATPIAAGEMRADGRDFRLVRCDAAENCDEIDRWIDDADGTGWDGLDTRVWFPTVEDVPPDGVDARTYVYYGNPSETGTPRAEVGQVFVFGDDFEAGVAKWTGNGLGETFAAEAAEVGAGQGALRIETGIAEVGGIHRDVDLPEVALVFTVLLRHASGTGSFGVLRAASVTAANRSPLWNQDDIRLHCELQLSSLLTFVDYPEYTTLEFGGAGFADGMWRRLTVVHDFDAGTVQAMTDDDAPTSPFSEYNGLGEPIRSIYLEGEGDGENGGGSSVYQIDNYLIYRYLDPPPTVTLGDVEVLA